MAHSTPGTLVRQIKGLRHQWQAAAGLPFAPLLTAEMVAAAVAQERYRFVERLYTPVVTLWVFLAQVVDACSVCVPAVARLLAYRLAQGWSACSAATGAYCRARRRLPEGVLARLTRTTGQQLLEAPAAKAWQWKGRDVKIVDGSTVSMPDTPANQAAYPQPRSQQPGVGFPLARLVVIFSLAVGTVLEAAIGPAQGKQRGETALFRSLLDRLRPGDLLLADRYYCSYFLIALARQRGVDVVVRQHQSRHCDFRRGQRLGRRDQVVTWRRPPRPDWMDDATYQQVPETLTLRELRVVVPYPRFRTKVVDVVTSLLDPGRVTRGDLEERYRARWHAELDLRALKDALHMDVLRCRSPELVRKEIWAHVLAYNLIRQVLAHAAAHQGLLPRQLSFKCALETLTAFAPYLATLRLEDFGVWWRRLLEALVQHRVGQRPNRSEPHARKRRPKSYPYLDEPRSIVRTRLGSGGFG